MPLHYKKDLNYFRINQIDRQFFQLSAVMLGVVSVIAFRLILIATMFQATKTFPGFFQKYARVIATGVAAFINAIIIEVGYLIGVAQLTPLFYFE